MQSVREAHLVGRQRASERLKEEEEEGEEQQQQQEEVQEEEEEHLNPKPY